MEEGLCSCSQLKVQREKFLEDPSATKNKYNTENDSLLFSRNSHDHSIAARCMDLCVWDCLWLVSVAGLWNREY